MWLGIGEKNGGREGKVNIGVLKWRERVRFVTYVECKGPHLTDGTHGVRSNFLDFVFSHILKSQDIRSSAFFHLFFLIFKKTCVDQKQR